MEFKGGRRVGGFAEALRRQLTCPTRVWGRPAGLLQTLDTWAEALRACIPRAASRVCQVLFMLPLVAVEPYCCFQ